MIIYYHPRYNFNLGILSYLHLFDGNKFRKVYEEISSINGIEIRSVDKAISQEIIDGFVGDLMRRLLPNKRYVLQALEVPYIPLLPFSLIESRVLEPMKWGVSGTLEASKQSLTGKNTWNLSGGYHHASKSTAEGFCIYNDIGIAIDQLISQGKIINTDHILIIDIDAHHGNGNAHIFMENKNITILDIYNNDVYPKSDYTKERVDINIPLKANTTGEEYLSKLKSGLNCLDSKHKLAFVIAGTDVIKSDPLGGLGLSVEESVVRDKLVLERLRELSIPAVFLGGGGYGKDSAFAIAKSISGHYEL